MAIGLAVGVAGAMLLLPVMRRVRLTSPDALSRSASGRSRSHLRARLGRARVGLPGGLRRRQSSSGDVALTRKGEIEWIPLVARGAGRDRRVRRTRAVDRVQRLDEPSVWVEGTLLALVLAFVLRPLAVAPAARARSASARGEALHRLGRLQGRRPDPSRRARRPRWRRGGGRIYGIIFVVVLFSVVVQGASIAVVAERLRVHSGMSTTTSSRVSSSSSETTAFANGRRIEELPLAERAWVGVLIRDTHPVSFGPRQCSSPAIACRCTASRGCRRSQADLRGLSPQSYE